MNHSLIDSGFHNNDIRSYKLRCAFGGRPQDGALRGILERQQPIQVSGSDV
jgi:hypothetical protein